MKILKKLKGLIIAFIFCFAIPFTLFFVVNEFFLTNNNTFSTGYVLCGVDIGGLTKKEAEQKLLSIFEEQEKQIKLEIKYEDKTWLFKESDFEVKTNIHNILDNAYKTNRKGGYLNKLKNINKINRMGFSPEIAVNYVLTNIDEKINNICTDVEYDAIDSQIKYNKTNKNFDISKSKTGLKVDKEQLYLDIVESLKKDCFAKVLIPTIKIQPTVTEELLLKATTKQSTFSTNYSRSNTDRKNNIKIATQTLNGICLQPSENFSFNEILGQRSLEKGYKQANIIKDGEFVKGIGGGICQVSSTLYNALLLANIDVTEVHKHSLPVSYVSPGLDAMVSWNSADLKFTNTTDLPIFITCECDGNNLNFNIFGDTKSKNLTIKTSSEIIKKIPHKGDKIIPDTNGSYSDKIMFKGEYFRTKYPKDGYEAKAYLEYFIDGKFSHKKQIRHSVYDSQQGVVYEGCDTLPEGMTLPKENTNKPIVI